MIKTLMVNNFRGYYGCSKAEFKPGLNIISGLNNNGKTSLLMAIAWGLGNDLCKSYCYKDSSQQFNHFAYNELEMNAEMTMEVAVETSFRGDSVKFVRKQIIKKGDSPRVINEFFEVWVNDKKGVYPDLIAKAILDEKRINEWFVCGDTLLHKRNYVVPEFYDYERVERVANVVFKSIYFRQETPYIMITKEGQILSGGDLPMEDSIYEALSVWYGMIFDGTQHKNKDFIVMVDDIVNFLSNNRASELSKLWDGLPQVIFCGYYDRIRDFGWKVNNLIEIKKDKDYRFSLIES